MHTTPALCGRYALYAMSTRFVVQALQIWALDQDAEFTSTLVQDASCSAHALGQADVGLG